MRRAAIILLVLSMAITAALFVHDYRYDPPSRPYTTGQYVAEILIVGSIYTAILFAIMFLPYLLIRGLRRRVKGRSAR